MMTNEASEKLNMEPETRILFGENETIRMFVKAKYEKGFLASTLSLYPINATNGMKPVCSFYTTAGRKFSLKSQGHSIRYLEGRGGMKMSLTSMKNSTEA